MKLLLNIFNTLLMTLLLAVAGLFLATLMPLPGNIEAKIVQSGSMEPSIPVGALVVIKPAEAYKPGEVITFGEDTKTKIPTTHRIISVRQDPPAGGGVTYYTTKGDANEEADTREVLHGEVIGKVMLSVPYVGFVLDFARKPMGFALLIGLPALIVILDELANIFVEVRRLRQSKTSAPTPEKRSSGLPYRARSRSRARPFFQGWASSGSRTQPDVVKVFEDIRVVYTRRRVSEDMFVRRKALLGLFAAFCVSGTLFLGSVGSTVSYFSDFEASLGNLLRAGVWGEVLQALAPPPLVLVEGNPSCADLGYTQEYKVEPVSTGESVHVVDGAGSITLAATEVEGEPRIFDWSSDFGVDAVIVKGGSDANHYQYDPPEEYIGDTGLHAPLGAGPDGSLYFGLSHISFCYDTEPVFFQALRLAPEEGGEVLGEETPPKEETASSTSPEVLEVSDELASTTPEAVPPALQESASTTESTPEEESPANEPPQEELAEPVEEPIVEEPAAEEPAAEELTQEESEPEPENAQTPPTEDVN